MIERSTSQDRPLARASPRDFAPPAGKLVPDECHRGEAIGELDGPFAYFPEDAMASIVATSPEGQVAGAGIIGREGFIHPALVLGSDTIPSTIQIRMPGEALGIAVADLWLVIGQSSSFHRTLLFARVNAARASYATLSNAVHQVDERLARWLLMCHDRSVSDDLLLTHGFMSITLAARRASVTSSLLVLEGDGLLGSERGRVTNRDRAALEEFAADADGKPEAECRRLLGPI